APPALRLGRALAPAQPRPRPGALLEVLARADATPPGPVVRAGRARPDPVHGLGVPVHVRQAGRAAALPAQRQPDGPARPRAARAGRPAAAARPPGARAVRLRRRRAAVGLGGAAAGLGSGARLRGVRGPAVRAGRRAGLRRSIRGPGAVPATGTRGGRTSGRGAGVPLKWETP